MEGYLGETEVSDLKGTPYEGYTKEDWILYFAAGYGQLDGAHHKARVLDNIVKIVKGTKVKVKLAKWDNGEEEYRIGLEEPSQEYKDFIDEYEEDGEYEWDNGH